MALRPRDRDRAVLLGRLLGAGLTAGSLALAAGFTAAAAAGYPWQSLHTTAASPPPVPVRPAPHQVAPPTARVIVHVVHTQVPQYFTPPAGLSSGGGGGSAPPPPPPPCFSTPSHPC